MEREAENMTEAPFVSICVCTYRRPELLGRCLDGIIAQTTDAPHELIVVENDAERHSAAVVEVRRERLRERGASVQYLLEPRRNISHARNRAVAAARGEVICFIDDDEAPDANWLEELLRCLRETPADVALGRVIGIVPESFPRWIRSSRLLREKIPQDREEVDGHRGRTSNVAVKREWFDLRPEPFDPEFGRTGGGDTEFFVFIAGRGARIFRCASAVVREHYESGRSTWRWHLRRGYRKGWGDSRIRRKLRTGRCGPLATLLRGGRGLARAGLVFLRDCRRGRVAALEFLYEVCRQAGRLGYFCGLRVEDYRPRRRKEDGRAH